MVKSKERWMAQGDKPDRRSQGDHRKKGKLLRATDFPFWSANAVADVIVSGASLNISFFLYARENNGLYTQVLVVDQLYNY